MTDFEALKRAMGDLEDETVMEMLQGALSEGAESVGLAMHACQDGMNIVGDKFESGVYFVADLIFAGDLMSEAMELLKPAFAGGGGGENLGRMILCTVEGDIHDIGKNIVKSVLEATGIEVLDLGVDVAPSAIVEAARKEGISVIALSGVLTLAIDAMKATVEEFVKADMRDNVKIIIGGAPVTEEYCKVVGADRWSQSVPLSVNICRDWLTGGE